MVEIKGVYTVYINKDLFGKNLTIPVIFQGICVDKKGKYVYFMDLATYELKIIDGSAVFEPLSLSLPSPLSLEGIPPGPSMKTDSSM